MAKAAPIFMESLAFHTHYSADGQPVAHPPGETYVLYDGQGMTADQLAESFIAMRLAKRVTRLDVVGTSGGKATVETETPVRQPVPPKPKK